MKNTVFKLVLGSIFVAGNPLLAMDDTQGKDSPSPHRALKSSSSHSSSSSLSPKVESGDVKASATWGKRGQSLTNSSGDQTNLSQEREKTSQRSRRGSVLENHESSESKKVLSKEEKKTTESLSKKDRSTRPPSERSQRSSTAKGEEASRIEKKESPGREESLPQDEKNMKKNKRNSDKKNKVSTSPRRQRAGSTMEKEVSSNKEQKSYPREVQTSSTVDEKGSPQEESHLLENRPEEFTKSKQTLADLEAFESKEATPVPLLGTSAVNEVMVWFPLMSLNQKNKESLIYAYYLPYETLRKEYFEKNELGPASSLSIDPSRTTVYNRLFRSGDNYNEENYNKSSITLEEYIERDKQSFFLLDQKEANRIYNKYLCMDGFTAIPKLLSYGDVGKLFDSGLHKYDHEIPLIKENDSLVPLSLKKQESHSLKHNIPPLILTNLPKKSLAEPSKNQQLIVVGEVPKREDSKGLNGESRASSPTTGRKLKETKADIPQSLSSSSGDSFQSIRENKMRLEFPYK